MVKPETVIRWHKQGFKLFWRYKSRRNNGRPVVSAEIRKLIRKIHADNPLWSPEKIYNQLIDLGLNPPSLNTIRKYLPKPTRYTDKSYQSWKTFITNHMHVTWSMDFLVVPTLRFKLLYIFVKGIHLQIISSSANQFLVGYITITRQKLLDLLRLRVLPAIT